MHRCSERLRARGYYDPEGTPNVSYREQIFHVFKKRSFNRRSQNETGAFAGDVSYSRRPTVDISDSDEESRPIFVKTETNHQNPPALQNSSPISNDSLSFNGQVTEPRRGVSWRCFLLFFFAVVLGFGALSHFVIRPLRDTVVSLKGELKGLREDYAALLNKLLPEAYLRPDFALNTHGGTVIYDLTSPTKLPNSVKRERANSPPPNFKTPSAILRGQTYPLTSGDCWAFEGQTGRVVISLLPEIQITHVTLGHITKEQSPNGQILAAPRKFTVYGLNDVKEEKVPLGSFEYKDDGASFQTFQIDNHSDKLFKIVWLEVESNYGNPGYTCLYTFKVHGKLP